MTDLIRRLAIARDVLHFHLVSPGHPESHSPPGGRGMPAAALPAPPSGYYDPREIMRLETCRREHLGREAVVRAVGAWTVVIGMLLSGMPLYGDAGLAFDGQAMMWLADLLVLSGYLLQLLSPVARVIHSLVLPAIAIRSFLAFSQTGNWHDFEDSFLTTLRVLGGLTEVAVILLFLHILWSEPSDMVFSSYYRQIVLGRTRHLATRPTVLLGLGLGFLLLVAVVLAAMVLALHHHWSGHGRPPG